MTHPMTHRSFTRRRALRPTSARAVRLTAWLVSVLALASVLVCATPTKASAWEFLRSANGNVEDGNAAMARGDFAAAITSYDRAARELPASPEVQLNRGLALLAAEDQAAARDAFLAASEPPAAPETRAAAYRNMGISYCHDGKARAEAEDGAQDAVASFREAVDSFERSLRAVPGDRDVAWNLELARRWLAEQEERVEQEEQEQEQEQNEDQENEDQENQDQQDQDQQDQDDQDQQDQDQQDQDNEDQQDDQDQQDQEGDDSEEPQEPEDGEGDEPEEQDEPEEPEEQEGEDDNEGEDESEDEPEPQDSQPQEEEALPPEMGRVLDALQDSEENLERARAAQRAGRRRPLRDW